MVKNIDELSRKIEERINVGDKKADIINLLKKDYYGVINTLTIANSLQKGKIPSELREPILVAICKNLEIENLDYFFTSNDIEIGGVINRLNRLEEENAIITKKIDTLTLKSR